MIKMLIGAIWGILVTLSVMGLKKGDSEGDTIFAASLWGMVFSVVFFVVWLILLISSAWDI